MKDISAESNFHSQIVGLLCNAKSRVIRTVNETMVLTSFEIGRMLVEVEQGGKDRAEYGKQLLQELSSVLTEEFGRGFSVSNIQQTRSFYLAYQKQQTPSVKSKTRKHRSLPDHSVQESLSAGFNLSWSHYLKRMKVDDENERRFYEIESLKNNWSVRELKRQFDSAFYTRLTLSRSKEKVKELSKKGAVLEKPIDAIKGPYILEFMGLPEHSKYSENELEQKIIDKLEHFLLELGNGFTFVARQKRISFDEKHFHIDLVFYNRILKSFVPIDLKFGELQHQDLGQMQMYVNYYDREIRLEDENKTIGINLCKAKSKSVVEYTLPEENDQIFTSKYETVLPSKDEHKSLLN